MVTAINYANDLYINAQKLNSKTALLHGADLVIEYGPKDIDTEFYLKNKKILDQKRGNGYWLWKPYIIKKTLEKIKEGQYLIYSDTGAFYINSPKLLVKYMQDINEEILIFTLPMHMKEKIWSKRDAFILMNCDSEEYANTPQRLAGFLLIKKTEFTYKFILEWLKYAQDPRIITDQKNCMGKSNYWGFKENRHDQTVLSLLSKRYNLKAFRDPSCSIIGKEEIKKNSYPQIFDLHRMPDVLEVEEVNRRRQKQVIEILDCWKSGKKVILYGAGKNAKKVILFLLQKGLYIDGCVVSNDQILDNKNIMGRKIYHLSSLPYEPQDVIILVTINIIEVQKNLTNSGYTYYNITNEVMSIINTEMEKLYVKNI